MCWTINIKGMDFRTSEKVPSSFETVVAKKVESVCCMTMVAPAMGARCSSTTFPVTVCEDTRTVPSATTTNTTMNLIQFFISRQKL